LSGNGPCRLLKGPAGAGRYNPEVVEGCDCQGMFPIWEEITLLAMQLVQIGEIRQKTVLDLVQEMAARQFAEMEQLKASVRSRAKVHGLYRAQPRCRSRKSMSR